MKMTFEKAMKASQAIGESGDCTVKALAVVKNIPYHIAHERMAKVGRKPRKGASTKQVLESLGVEPTSGNVFVSRAVFGRNVTPKTFAKLMPKGRYYCLTGNHAIAVIDGVVEDWTAERRNQIKAFIKVA